MAADEMTVAVAAMAAVVAAAGAVETETMETIIMAAVATDSPPIVFSF